jgi:hypothetical protein
MPHALGLIGEPLHSAGKRRNVRSESSDIRWNLGTTELRNFLDVVG